MKRFAWVYMLIFLFAPLNAEANYDPDIYDYSWDIIKYRSNGDLLWHRSDEIYEEDYHFDGDIIKLATAPDGRIFLLGYVDNYLGYFTVIYSPSGSSTWINEYKGDVASDLVIGESRHFAVTGFDDWGDGRFLTNVYKLGGGQVMQLIYDGEGKDEAIGVTVDEANNIYVTGANLLTSCDIVTVKYDSAGVEQWAVRYGQEGKDQPIGVVTDSMGNIVVCGMSQDDLLLIKYDTDGNIVWLYRSNNLDNHSTTQPLSFAIDKEDNPIAAASRCDNDTCRIDVAKFDPEGKLIWIYSGNEERKAREYPVVDLEIDDHGNIYAAGSLSETGYSAIKFHPDGYILWQIFNDDFTNPITIDQEGNLYSFHSDTSNYFSKYDPNGRLIWQKGFALLGPNVELRHITTDPYGYIIFAGHIFGFQPGSNSGDSDDDPWEDNPDDDDNDDDDNNDDDTTEKHPSTDDDDDQNCGCGC